LDCTELISTEKKSVDGGSGGDNNKGDNNNQVFKLIE